MSRISRYGTAIMLGYAAFALARGVGIPAWVDWPTDAVPADATDIGVLVGLAALHRLKPARQALKGPTDE